MKKKIIIISPVTVAAGVGAVQTDAPQQVSSNISSLNASRG